MKISVFSDAVTRINNGESPMDVLNRMRESSRTGAYDILRQMRIVVKSRPSWEDALERIDAAFTVNTEPPPRNGAHVEYVTTPKSEMRRHKILKLLEKHPAGLTTTALLTTMDIDRNTLHTDMAPLVDGGKVRHSPIISGRSTTWRLTK